MILCSDNKETTKIEQLQIEIEEKELEIELEEKRIELERLKKIVVEEEIVVRKRYIDEWPT